jgi:suppressor of fused
MFDWLKPKKPEPVPLDPEPATALGWDAIEAAFACLYPGQRPRHWKHDGILRMHDLRNPPENPFDGVNIYDGGAFWHYVSLGMSDLYGKDGEGEWSGFGYEFTFRLAKPQGEKGGGQDPPLWPINVMGSLGRAAFTGSDFRPGDTVQMGPIDGRPETRLTGVLILNDPGFDEVLETPNGKLELLLLLGIENEVRERARALGSASVTAQLRGQNPELMTRVVATAATSRE